MTSSIDVIIFFFISLNHKIRTLMISFEKSRWHSKYNASFSPCNNETTMVCTFAKRSYQNVSFFYEIYLGWWNFIGSLAARFLFCFASANDFLHLNVTPRVPFYKIFSTARYKNLQRNKFKGRKDFFFHSRIGHWIACTYNCSEQSNETKFHSKQLRNTMQLYLI